MIPIDIKELFEERKRLRDEKQFKSADNVRKIIEDRGFEIVDTPDGSVIRAKEQNLVDSNLKGAKVALFGSGEISPTGRKVHEFLIREHVEPVKIAILETPAGFEVNPDNWYKKLADMMAVGLQNYHPEISIVRALRSDGQESTNNLRLLKPLEEAQYIHTGAGSPTYAARHLKDSRAYNILLNSLDDKKSLSFASAAAIACGSNLLPVYEIYKAGEDLHWKKGLNFFSKFGLDLTIIPHFDNTEGGADIDTSRCFMGVRRFDALLSQLPSNSTVLGIDEQTACIFDFETNIVSVMGNGAVTIIHSSTKKMYRSGETFMFNVLL